MISMKENRTSKIHSIFDKLITEIVKSMGGKIIRKSKSLLNGCTLAVTIDKNGHLIFFNYYNENFGGDPTMRIDNKVYIPPYKEERLEKWTNEIREEIRNL